MSKYTIRIEGGDMMESRRTVECEGFVLLANNNGCNAQSIMMDVNMLELAAIIAGTEPIMYAAKLAAALEQLHPGKQLSTVIEEICEGE